MLFRSSFSEALAHQVFQAAGNHQFLGSWAQCREGKLVLADCNRAVTEINVGVQSGTSAKSGIVLLASITTKPLNQCRAIKQEIAIVEGIAFVGSRKGTGNHQGNPSVLERGGRLFAAGAGAEVETADHDVTFLCHRLELGVVIFHGYRRHFFVAQIFAVGVLTRINSVGIEVVGVAKQ